MDDTAAVSALAASSWETMAADAEAYATSLRYDHARALEELLAAEFEAFLLPGTMADLRLGIARLALGRIERRLGK